MKKIKSWINLPDDWLFKWLRIPVNTALTFYLFQYYSEIGFVEAYWEMSDKNYIISFLFSQVILLGFFFGFLSKLLEFPLRWLAEKQIKKFQISNNHGDRKKLIEAQHFIIRFFSLNLSKEIQEEFLEEEIYLENKEKAITTLITKSSKWMSLFIELLLILVLVYHLSAWYILPIFIVVLIFIMLYAVAASVVLHNIEFIERIRRGVSRRVSTSVEVKNT